MILFGIPAVLSIPAGQHTMTTQLRAFMVSEDDLLGLASAYAMPMLDFGDRHGLDAGHSIGPQGLRHRRR